MTEKELPQNEVITEDAFKKGTRIEDPINYTHVELKDTPERWRVEAYKNRILFSTLSAAYMCHLTSHKRVEFHEAPSYYPQEAEKRLKLKKYGNLQKAISDIYSWMAEHVPDYEKELLDINGIGEKSAEVLAIEHGVETRKDLKRLQKLPDCINIEIDKEDADPMVG